MNDPNNGGKDGKNTIPGQQGVKPPQPPVGAPPPPKKPAPPQQPQATPPQKRVDNTQTPNKPHTQKPTAPPQQPAQQRPGQQMPPQKPAAPTSPGQGTAPHIQQTQPQRPTESKAAAATPQTQKPAAPVKLGEKLINEGIISDDQLQIALKTQKDRGGPSQIMLGGLLVELGFITESTLGEVLAESTGVERFDPKTTVLDPALIKQIPKNVAARHKIVPVLLEDNTVYMAMSDIYDVMALDQVHRYFPRDYTVKPLYCPEADLLEIIDNYYEFEMSISGILREIEANMSNEEQELSGELEGYTNPTVRLVDALLIDAIKLGASDIHFEPEGSFIRLRYRIDGALQQIRSFHRDYWPAIAVRIKIISGMNIAETRHPQDGRITYNVLGREVDFRVASHPCIYGENIVLRILDKKKALLPMEALGFSDEKVSLLKKLLKRPEGIIIVTGPTGSGKTTTLYSVLNYINSIDVNIMTLEDPVEYQLSMIRQANIRAASGMDFAEGIKSCMRQDPDIIFIGEIRDHETATMALRASMTGHQVYSTLHTNDALGIIPRLVDIGLKPTLIAGAIICAIAQRLARKLCVKCAEEKPATAEECKILGVDATNPPTIKHHKGCEACGYTGYKGRVAISEILQVDNNVDELIARSATRAEFVEYLKKVGFVSMVDDAIQKILAGLTDLEEIIGTVNMTDRL